MIAICNDDGGCNNAELIKEMQLDYDNLIYQHKLIVNERNALQKENAEIRERIEPYITMMDADDIVWFCEMGCADPNG